MFTKKKPLFEINQNNTLETQFQLRITLFESKEYIDGLVKWLDDSELLLVRHTLKSTTLHISIEKHHWYWVAISTRKINNKSGV